MSSGKRANGSANSVHIGLRLYQVKFAIVPYPNSYERLKSDLSKSQPYFHGQSVDNLKSDIMPIIPKRGTGIPQTGDQVSRLSSV